ncbi:phosphatidylinositol-binding protein scs2 [Dispira parvispora]|uniref:Phosphatidylinositol-binding protein scs2 n=1 Tax=Dispira parvispora TaxID=1520584 RepID=A0A9W8AUN1_9FUNG|nr:phosphatidylinositol-binding protein scs2 [Dispira parvispora]
MSLVIEPSSHLTFQRPFTTPTEDTLILKNETSSPIAFKVKTTAPKQYCVRPNSGRIDAGLEMRVQVILQPMRDELPLDYKCKDKFLVQSIAVTPELETLSLNDLWANIEVKSKKLAQEHKLRCVFLPPAAAPQDIIPSTATTAEPAPRTVTPPAPTESAPAPVPAVASPVRHSIASSAAADQFSSPVSVATTLPNQSKLVEPLTPEISRPVEETSVPQAFRSQLDQAQNVIGQLRKEVSTYKSELGQVRSVLKDTQEQLHTEKATARVAQASTRTSQPAASTVTQELVDGFSPQVLGIVALTAFLVGYLFF